MIDTEEAPAAVFAYYPRLQRVKEHVDQHLDEDLSLGTAARIAGLEEKYFSAFFRRKTGICFRDWISRSRVRRAAEMMKAEDCSITCIALAVGFQDLRTFERAFQRCMGLTPLAYKKAVRPR
ncbi:MAG: AraC family transcriptional regulator [Kiloniellales bacterium]|nr:AraC family transcriptional regulator [Kiloniellales bacterium]